MVLIGPATDGYSEILAGCLHQTGRATLIGQPTNGNIRRWALYSFSDGSSANITVEKFTPASGADWEANGLTPDIEIAQGWDEFAADDEDEALRAALIWLQQ